MSDESAMTAEQCRAARGWLGMTQQALADEAKVGLSTVKTFESGITAPIANNLNAIKKAFEARGVTMVWRDGSAVGIAVVQQTSEKWPPADGARRRPGPQGRKVANPKSRRSVR